VYFFLASWISPWLVTFCTHRVSSTKLYPILPAEFSGSILVGGGPNLNLVPATILDGDGNLLVNANGMLSITVEQPRRDIVGMFIFGSI